MPYSKNPHAYPADFLALIDKLPTIDETRLTLPCATRSEAMSKKVMMQSFFAAVRRHSGELQDSLERQRQRAASTAGQGTSQAAADLQLSYQEAKVLTGIWEQRAFTASQWQLTVTDTAIILAKRNVGGVFAASLAAVLNTPSVQEDNTPTAQTSTTDDQFAMLRAASQSLQSRQEGQAPDILPPANHKTV